jgi:hypothetical protein
MTDRIEKSRKNVLASSNSFSQETFKDSLRIINLKNFLCYGFFFTSLRLPCLRLSVKDRLWHCARAGSGTEVAAMMAFHNLSRTGFWA